MQEDFEILFYVPKYVVDVYKSHKTLNKIDITEDRQTTVALPASLVYWRQRFFRYTYDKLAGYYHYTKSDEDQEDPNSDVVTGEIGTIRSFIVSNRYLTIHIIYKYARLYDTFKVLKEMEHFSSNAEFDNFLSLVREYGNHLAMNLGTEKKAVHVYTPRSCPAIATLQEFPINPLTFSVVYNYCLAKFFVEDELASTLPIPDSLLEEYKVACEEFEEKISTISEDLWFAIEKIKAKLDSAKSFLENVLEEFGYFKPDDLQIADFAAQHGFNMAQLHYAAQVLEREGKLRRTKRGVFVRV